MVRTVFRRVLQVRRHGEAIRPAYKQVHGQRSASEQGKSVLKLHTSCLPAYAHYLLDFNIRWIYQLSYFQRGNW
jgi:hypothetical protein